VGRDRTADTRIFSPLLYRLSYRTGGISNIQIEQMNIEIGAAKIRGFSQTFLFICRKLVHFHLRFLQFDRAEIRLFSYSPAVAGLW
jgi:hypothetical protein